MPYTRQQAIDLYFIEHRGKLLDLASFLDRIDRAGVMDGAEDFRVSAFRAAIRLLVDGKPERTRRALELLSDPTTDPIASAGVKGATGAFSGPGERAR